MEAFFTGDAMMSSRPGGYFVGITYYWDAGEIG